MVYKMRDYPGMTKLERESRYHILETKTVDGVERYYSLTHGKTYDSLDGFKPVNSLLLEKIENLETAVGSSMDVLGNKIDHDQLTFFGSNINGELINNVVTYTFGSVIGIIQQELS